MEIEMPLRFSRALVKLLTTGSTSFVLLGFLCATQPAAQAPAASSRSPSSDAEAARFVDDLLAKMTLEEKVGQMSQIALNTPDKSVRDERILKGEVGSFRLNTDGKEINRLQHLAMEKSRLHIPLIFGFDVIHGFRTIYPVHACTGRFVGSSRGGEGTEHGRTRGELGRGELDVCADGGHCPRCAMGTHYGGSGRGSLSRFAYGRSAGAGISG